MLAEPRWPVLGQSLGRDGPGRRERKRGREILHHDVFDVLSNAERVSFR